MSLDRIAPLVFVPRLYLPGIRESWFNGGKPDSRDMGSSFPGFLKWAGDVGDGAYPGN